MKKAFLFLISISFVGQVICQHKKNLSFKSYTAIGIAIGESSTNSTIESINGIKTINWFVGLGVAYDSYKYKSVPFFVNAKYFFGNAKHFFATADGGYNTVFLSKDKDDKNQFLVRYKGGLYAKTGLGMLIHSSKRIKIYGQFDFGIKRLSRKTQSQTYYGSPPYDEGYTNIDVYKYSLKTYNLKLGITF